MKAQPVEILLVESNPVDVDLTLEALEEAKLRNNVHVAMDGEEALSFLRREGEHPDAPRADLILPDAYEHRANAYIVKPVDFEQFFRTVQSLEDFWLTVVRLPKG